MTGAEGINRINGVSNRALAAPKYPKAWAVISTVALVALAAGGALLAHHLGARHLPSFIKSHSFQLATEIGGPLGAISSIAGGILVTRAKKRAIEELQGEFTRLQAIESGDRICDAIENAHSKHRLARETVSEEGSCYPADEQTLTTDPTSLQLQKNTELLRFNHCTTLISSSHLSSPTLPASYSGTAKSTASGGSYTIGKMNAEIFLPADNGLSQGQIIRTIHKTYKERLEALRAEKSSGVFSPEAWKNWLTEKVRRDSISLDEKSGVMADAIAATLSTLKQPASVIVDFEGQLFVGKTADISVTYSSPDQLNALQEAGVYSYSKEALNGHFVIGDQEFGEVPANEIATFSQQTKNVDSYKLLNAALQRRNSFSHQLNFDASNVKPMACMVYKV